MNISSIEIFVAGAIGLIGWLLFILKRLKKYENKEALRDIHEESKNAIDSQSLDELINDTNKRRRARDKQNPSS